MRRIPGSLLLLLTLLFSIQLVAYPPRCNAEATTHTIVVVLNPAYVIAPPEIHGSSLVFSTDPSKAPAGKIPGATRMEPLYKDSASSPSIRGPWIVQLTTSELWPDYLGDIRALPEVVWCGSLDPEDQGDIPITLGEATKVWFPEEADEISEGVFCQAQADFHSANANELPAPTLLDAGTDACSWYVSSAVDLDLPQAWGITRGDSNVVVAMIDYGVDWTHPDFGNADVPGEGATFDQLITSYTDGAIYHNAREVIGDNRNDGACGIAGYNDDHDDKTDEDPTGLVPGNTPEADVLFGTWTNVDGFTFHDADATWDPAAIVGEYVIPEITAHGGERDSIVAATQTSLTVANLYGRTSTHYDSLSTIYGPMDYMISDGLDTDGDDVVDDWWAYDPNDDDENGFSDDIKGWDFIDPNYLNNGPNYYLKPSIRYGDNDERPVPGAEHGQVVAGVLGAQANGIGFVGVAPGCKIQPYRAPVGYIGTVLDITAAGAIRHARYLKDENGKRVVDIISLSIGMNGPIDLNDFEFHRWKCDEFTHKTNGEYDNPFAAQLDSALTEGIIVVAAAGNSDAPADSYAPDDPYLMHCFPGVISVGGTRGTHPFSHMGGNEGWGMTYGPWVDVSAPAQNIPVTIAHCSDGCSSKYGLDASGEQGWLVDVADGTSLAAPMVAGVAALMLSANPNLSPAALKAKLTASVDTVKYDGYEELRGNAGKGRLNAYKALVTYGDVPCAQGDTLWADTVWVGGDLHTLAGNTLRLEAGTVVKIAQDDLLGAGTVGTQIEWRIEGNVQSQGTESEPVVFEVFSDSADSLWGPLAIVDNSQTLDFSYVEFRGLVVDHITSPAEGEVILAEQPITIEWSTDYLESGGPSSVPYELTVDLEFSKDGGSNYTTLATGVTASLGSWEWTPTSSDATIEGKIRVTFIGPASIELGHDETTSNLNVLNANNLTYANMSLKEPENPSSDPILNYEGRPYSSVAFDYDGDGDQDLFITQRDKSAKLYENRGTLSSGAPSMVSPSGSTFGSDTPGTDLHGVSFTDLDDDGDLDLFVAATATTQTDRARLYKNNGDGTFTDIADSLGLTTYFEDSWVGVWGDYDGDMRPDLFVGRGQSDPGEPYDNYPAALTAQTPVLLHNITTPGSPAFEDVSSSTQSGILESAQDGGLPCAAATWGDIDFDGDMDLVAGSTASTVSSPGSRLYINNGDGTFTDEWETRTGGSLGEVCSVDLVNMNYATGDSVPDLVVGILTSGSTQSSIYWNNGTGSFNSHTDLQAGITPSSVQLIDFGNTGRFDVLVLPDSLSGISQGPKLFCNYDNEGTPSFVECATAAGLSDIGGAYGLSRADFDGDGREDLLFGRRVDSHVFYYRMEPEQQQGPGTGESVRIHLVGAGGNNPMGLGASVTLLIDGTKSQRQVVSGGDGRGGQHSAELVFGLGDYTSGALQAKVDWPDGWSQTEDLSTSSLNVINDSSPVNLLANTVNESNMFDGSLTTTWTFTWETEYASDPALDTVYVTPTGGCGTSWTLRYDSPVVDHEITRLANGHFLHKMIAHERPCIVLCFYSYYCESATSSHVSNNQSNPKIFKTKLCAM